MTCSQTPAKKDHASDMIPIGPPCCLFCFCCLPSDGPLPRVFAATLEVGGEGGTGQGVRDEVLRPRGERMEALCLPLFFREWSIV